MIGHNRERTENMFKIFSLLFLVLLLVPLFSSATSALGVAPSRQTFNFDPGKIIHGTLTIINNEGHDVRLGIYAQGDIMGQVTLSQNLVDISSDQETAEISYELILPNKALRPGNHEMELVVRQFPKDSDGETVVTAQMAVIAQVIVRVPYPGKYAEGKLFMSNTADPKDPVGFNLMLSNLGEDDIDDAHVRFEIYDPEWLKVGDAESVHSDVKSKQEKRFDAVWTPEVSKGTYTAVVMVFYDNSSFKIDRQFDLGEFIMEVDDISVDKFALGDVAKFDIRLFNDWNLGADDVFVEMIVEDAQGNQLTEFKTSSIDIPAHEYGELEAYWYTEGVFPGIYTVKLLVHYAGKITQIEEDFEVSLNRITRLGLAGHAIVTEEEAGEVKVYSFIVIAVVVLLFINLLWFYLWRKKAIRREGGMK